MTNREYMVALLSDASFIDDGYAAYEAMIHYNIKCPYFSGDNRCHCKDKEITRELCYECKEEWLDSEVDE